jgi:diguanylate cyclase
MPNAPAYEASSPSDTGWRPVSAEKIVPERDLRFVRQIHVLRTLGLALGFFCVASVLRLHEQPLVMWVALAASAFLWPHVARSRAMRSVDPARAERLHLTLDSALGGVAVALMQFNLLPSVLLVTMLSMDKIAVGGIRFWLRTVAVLAAACLLTSALLGFAVDLETPMSVVITCIPLLITYPLLISFVMHTLTRKVAKQNSRLTQMSSTDELTGLANRRQGLVAAEFALAGHRRSGRPAAIIVIDIDRFKETNDRFGHPAGDQVLRDVATMLRQCSRATDTPARYGGDEFLLVLPDSDLAAATRMTQRIRELLAAAPFDAAPGLRCTVSFGAAEAYSDMADVEDWIQQADAALYRAKAMGRDCLACAPKPGPEFDALAHGCSVDTRIRDKPWRRRVSQ